MEVKLSLSLFPLTLLLLTCYLYLSGPDVKKVRFAMFDFQESMKFDLLIFIFKGIGSFSKSQSHLMICRIKLREHEYSLKMDKLLFSLWGAELKEWYHCGYFLEDITYVLDRPFFFANALIKYIYY